MRILLLLLCFVPLSCGCDTGYLPSATEAPRPKYHVSITVLPALTLWGYGSLIYDITADTIILSKQGGSFLKPDTLIHYIDTSRYVITVAEQAAIITHIRKMTTHDTLYWNKCIIDGLRFSFLFSIDGKEHTGNVSNAYNESIFAVIDVINTHVPDSLKIVYNKAALIDEMKDCDSIRKHK